MKHVLVYSQQHDLRHVASQSFQIEPYFKKYVAKPVCKGKKYTPIKFFLKLDVLPKGHGENILVSH